MLNVKSLKGSSAAIAGYLTKNQEKSGEKGYYQKNEAAPSRWQGRGAEMLGLSGTVDPKQFMDLLEKGPDGMPAPTADRRKGVDLTWSVPKSVSMLIEAAPPEQRERMLELCREANAVAMQHIEDSVVTARYGKGGQISEKTGTAIIATFEHDDARPTPDADGNLKIDPDIHFHNALINATRDADGWRSMDLDMGALSVEQHLADFKAKAHLAAGLEKMGVSIEKTKDGFEIAGISREQIMAFSDRSKEIEKSLADKGLSRETATAAERNVSNLDTRQNKLRDKSQIDLRYEWHQRLREEGVDFDKLYDPSRDQGQIAKSGQEYTKDSADFSTERFSRSTNPVTEKEQHNEQRSEQRDDFFERHFTHTPDDQLYPERPGDDGHDNSMQPLSGSRLDAGERRQSAMFLQDCPQANRPADRIVRREPAAGQAVTEEKARQAIDAALDHLSEKDSLFDKRQLALEATKQGMGEVSGADIESAMRDHKRIVWAGEQTKTVEKAGVAKDGTPYTKKTQIRAEMVTAVETVAREGWIQGFCAEGRGKLSPLMTPEAAEKAALAAEKRQGFSFADDQREAVIRTLTSTDRVSAMIGGAGTGKTTAMRSMVDAAREMGFETVGLTPSHGARQELLDAGTDENVTTASFLMQKAKEDQAPRLYILDEAGMTGDRTMQQVLQKMGPKDRILLSGDPDQLKPVEAGDPLQTLVDKGVIDVARLTKVQRQAKAEDKDLLKLGQAWADRDTKKALELVQKYIKEAPIEATGKGKDGEPKITQEDRRQGIADATVHEYMGRSNDDRARTMIICPTNDVRGRINAGIRENLQASGELPQNAVTVTQLVKTDLSQKHMKQAHQYDPGQILRTTEGKGKDRKTVDYEVSGVDGQRNTLTLTGPDGKEKLVDASKIDPKKWQCFDQAQGMGLAVGEKIVIRDNSQQGAQNGDGGKITSVLDGKISVRMDRGQVVILDSKQALAMDYGYARTVNDSQGKTVDLPIMTGEASAGSSRNLLLVGNTRGKYGLVVITDDAAGLIKRSQDFADKNVAAEARKNADLKTDRRLDRLDSVMKNGKERGANVCDAQLHPDRQQERDQTTGASFTAEQAGAPDFFKEQSEADKDKEEQKQGGQGNGGDQEKDADGQKVHELENELELENER